MTLNYGRAANSTKEKQVLHSEGVASGMQTCAQTPMKRKKNLELGFEGFTKLTYGVFHCTTAS